MRDVAGGCLVGVVWLCCVGVHYGCGKDSERCRGTWLTHFGDDSIFFESMGGNATRGCFSLALAKETALGDSVLSLSSVFFGVGVVYVRPGNAGMVVCAVMVAVASFVFHATYGELARFYDIISTRLVGAGMACDVLVLYLPAVRTRVEVGAVLVVKGFLMCGAGYLTWCLYMVKNDGLRLWDRQYTLEWLAIPGGVGFVGMVVAGRPWGLEEAVRLGMGVGFVAVGGWMLFESRDPCHEKSQFHGTHVWGHFLIGIGLAVVASLRVWGAGVEAKARREPEVCVSEV